MMNPKDRKQAVVDDQMTLLTKNLGLLEGTKSDASDENRANAICDRLSLTQG